MTVLVTSCMDAKQIFTREKDVYVLLDISVNAIRCSADETFSSALHSNEPNCLTVHCRPIWTQRSNHTNRRTFSAMFSWVLTARYFVPRQLFFCRTHYEHVTLAGYMPDERQLAVHLLSEAAVNRQQEHAACT